MENKQILWGLLFVAYLWLVGPIFLCILMLEFITIIGWLFIPMTVKFFWRTCVYFLDEIKKPQQPQQ